MKNKNGFVATSLIYSFFLVFIAIISALLRSYLSNQTILQRYNEEVANNLNNKTYSVTLIATNSYIEGGHAFTNLFEDGAVTNFPGDWKYYSGSSGYNRGNSALNGYSNYFTKNLSYNQTSSIYKEINLIANATYYLSFAINTTGITGNNETNIIIQLCHSNYACENITNFTANNASNNKWQKVSARYISQYNEIGKIVVGEHNKTINGTANFADFMFINLSASFSSDYIPNKVWMDSNIDFFNNTINYYKKSNIKKGSKETIRMAPYSGFNKISSSCKDSTNNIIPSVINNNQLTIDTIKNNIICHVDWSK